MRLIDADALKNSLPKCDMELHIIDIKQKIDRTPTARENRADTWIKITDDPATLPKETDWYMTCDKMKVCRELLYDLEEWYTDDGVVFEVTHWQSLPAPPKE